MNEAIPAVAEKMAQLTDSKRSITFYVVVFQKGRGDLSSINWQLFNKLRCEICEKITSDPGNTRIDLWIDSPGGSAHFAYKIMLLLRSRCSFLRAVVPVFAKSAATLMVLGADEIIMTPYAEVGPLDVQMPHPEQEDQHVSALDITLALQELAKNAISMVVRGGAVILSYTGLKRRETLSAMLQFAADFTKPVIEKLDPMLIHRATNELAVARRYASRLWSMRQNKSQMSKERAEKLFERLVSDYPSHRFVISPAELKELGLITKEPSDYQDWQSLEKFHKFFEQTQDSYVGVFTKADLVPIINNTESCNEHQEHSFKDTSAQTQGSSGDTD